MWARARSLLAIPPAAPRVSQAGTVAWRVQPIVSIPSAAQTLSSSSKRPRALTPKCVTAASLRTIGDRSPEAEQRQREHEEREAAEARKAQETERADDYAKHGWLT